VPDAILNVYELVRLEARRGDGRQVKPLFIEAVKWSCLMF
jgi:hypothetical protein